MASIYSWESFIRIHGGEPGARDVFEKVIYELLRAENHDKEVHIVKASQGDGGIDVYVHREDGIDIYQCKFFMETLNKIMDLYAEEFEEEEYFSNELKQKAGFSKDGDKGFEGIITGLQMQTYLCVHDFRQRRNRIRDMNTVILVSCQMNREYQHPMFTQQLSSVIMVQEKV